MQPLYTIRTVESKTGLSQHTIRAWERRYGAIDPDRTGTNRRLYTDSDVDKLSLLRTALASGHTISQVAHLSIDELNKLLLRRGGPSLVQAAGQGEVAGAIYEGCCAAISDLDATRLVNLLEHGGALLGVMGNIQNVIVPLLVYVGEKWHAGGLRIGQEHLATTAIRLYLGQVRTGLMADPRSSTVVVATLPGQIHELGASIVSVIAALNRLNVVFLGANLPAMEVGYSVEKSRASTVCISLIYPQSDPNIREELVALRAYLPNTQIIVGGQASESYKEVLGQIDANHTTDLSELNAWFAEI